MNRETLQDSGSQSVSDSRDQGVQRIGEILPVVLARYGLVQAKTRQDGHPRAVPMPLDNVGSASTLAMQR